MDRGRKGPCSTTQVTPSMLGGVLAPQSHLPGLAAQPGHRERPAVPLFSPTEEGCHTSPGSATDLGREAMCAPTEVVGGHRPCALGEESQRRCFVAAPDQEIASALPHPETFPPDEITSPAREQAPIVKGWGLERKGVFQALKNSSPEIYESTWNRVAHSPSSSTGPVTPIPHRDLVVTSWRVLQPRPGRGS